MISYSDYDSDGYSSNEDADYVPSDDNLSEDDINECVKEEALNTDHDTPHLDQGIKKKKKKQQDIGMRKRKKGVLTVECGEEEEKAGDEAAAAQAPHEEMERVNKGAGDERLKRKSDDLWASFLSDVGSRPKDSTAASQTASTEQGKEEGTPSSKESKAPQPATVTITKVFDFAGEEVRVSKEVSTNSKEAQSYLKSQSAQQEESGDDESQSSSLPGPSAKRPVGMSSILGRLGGKKQKMSTLEKSKMDWDNFKSEEGITEELAIHNRGREGYVERKNFLERVDHRQFQLEKAVRLSNMKQQ